MRKMVVTMIHLDEPGSPEERLVRISSPDRPPPGGSVFPHDDILLACDNPNQDTLMTMRAVHAVPGLPWSAIDHRPYPLGHSRLPERAFALLREKAAEQLISEPIAQAIKAQVERILARDEELLADVARRTELVR